MDMLNKPLGNVTTIACQMCGQNHEFVNAYNQRIQRSQWLAIRDCPNVDKRKEEQALEQVPGAWRSIRTGRVIHGKALFNI